MKQKTESYQVKAKVNIYLNQVEIIVQLIDYFFFHSDF